MSYLATVVGIAGLNVILALSVYMNLAVGQFSLAQVGFWAIGAYCSAILTTLYGMPLVPALAAGALVCALIGILLGYPCLRIRGIYLALATLGFSEMVRVFFLNFKWQVTRDGVPLGPDATLGFRNILVLTDVPDILITVALLILFFIWLSRSRFGLAMDSIRQDDLAAESLGIDVVAAKVVTFAIGAAIAGIGGGLYANYISYITSDNFGFQLTLVSVLFVALGGSTTFLGPILGAVLLTFLPEYIRFLADYRMMFYGLLVLLIMIWRPKGLIDDALLHRLGRALRGREAEGTRGA
jgi:branched-chain amino acid transport system permease protein